MVSYCPSQSKNLEPHPPITPTTCQVGDHGMVQDPRGLVKRHELFAATNNQMTN